MQLTRRPIDLFAGLLEAGAFVTAVFTIATSFDFVHQYLELFAHFRVQYLLVSLALAGLLAALRRRRFAVLMVVMAVINGAYVLPWYFGKANASENPTLSLLHANVLSSNDDLAELISAIDETDPDLVFVQELTPDHTEFLQQLDERYPYQLLEPQQDSFGIGVYSRQPFRRAEVLRTPPRDLPSIELGVDFDGAPIALISSHPVPPIGPDFYRDRNTQLEYLARLAAGTAGSVVLIGDLNTSMWASNYRSLEAESGLRNAQKGHGIQPSWPLFMPIAMIPIDHALLSHDLIAAEATTLSAIGSDHLPLLVRLQRASPEE